MRLHLARALARLTLVAALVVGFLFVAAGPTYAATVDDAPAVVWALDPLQVINLLVAVIFPVLVGVLTTSKVRSSWKAIFLATISLASGLASGLADSLIAHQPFDLAAALLTGLAAWIIAIATHFGFWKPTGTTAAVENVGIRSRSSVSADTHNPANFDNPGGHNQP